MKEHGWIFILIIAVVLGLVTYSVTFIVRSEQVAIVKTFGKAGAPVSGAVDAGLHWKAPWPIQSLVRYETSQQSFDDTYEQIATSDSQPVLVTVNCRWVIADPTRFVGNQFGSAAAAEESLRKLIRSVKSAVVSGHPLVDFVNVDPKDLKLDAMEREMLDRANLAAERDYGVKFLAVTLKNLGLPKAVTEKVIENQKQERELKAKYYRDLGKSVAEAIRASAIQAREQILAFANKRAALIRAEGDQEAAKYYEIFARNEQFAKFLVELNFMKESLKTNSVFFLDANVVSAIQNYYKPLALPATQPAGAGK